MELTTIASFGVVLASVGYYFREMFYKLFDIPLVNHLLNITLGITAREGAELVIQAGKEIILVVARILHLVLHIAGQVALLVKNLAVLLRSFMSAIYVVLSTGNAILQSILEFPTWVYDWLTTPPLMPPSFTTIFYILLISLLINLGRRFTSQRTGGRERHSGTKDSGK